AEAEFYIFDSVQYDSQPQGTFYKIDAKAAAWNSGRDEDGGNLGYKPRTKGGYFPVSPTDHYADLRDEMAVKLEDAGMVVERGHHEVGSAGQAEINYKFGELLESADNLMLFKYIIKNTAHAAGKTVTFMPKPVMGDNGSGMHCHQSLWKDGAPLFYDEVGYAGLSDTARYYIGGLLHHAPSLLAFTNPTINSYHRLVPGFEAPVNLVYSQRNRSACIRIPITGNNPKAKRLEFRCPDPSSNPYLAFSAMLMAGLDGIRNKIEPPTPVDKDLYELPPDELATVAQVPGSLDEVLIALENDHEYLLEGGVFTPDLIETWIAYKRETEIDALRLRPHPYEFQLYYDI
ncbi:MAG: glutamine synthetase, partial [Actinomycetota bacterium]|nr:glutamine synthetase [Actinomycetota bacterium]